MDKKRIKDLLKLARLNKELRQKNEDKVLTRSKYKEVLTEFHEPVTDKFKAQSEAFEDIKTIENALRNMTIPPSYIEKLPELPYAESPQAQSTPKFKYRAHDLDEGLDVPYLIENEFKLPSEIAADPDLIENMLKKVEHRSKYIGSLKGKVNRRLKNETNDVKTRALQEELNLYDSDLEIFRRYREKLKVLKAGSKVFTITGDGLLSELDKLTDKLIRGSKSKKIYNQVVSLLDILNNEGIVNKEDIEKYYEKFLSI